MRRSYAAFLDSGPRSTEKLAPLHGWVQEELRRHLRDSAKYTLTGQTAETRNERKIEGRHTGSEWSSPSKPATGSSPS